jgi:Cu(I)/Ag(I) efflux system membrane fusion protein
VTEETKDFAHRADEQPTTSPWRLAVYAAVLVIAGGGVYFATRGNGKAAPMAEGHNHAAMTGGGGAKPVMLSEADQRRIGVTFATAELGQLTKEVRTVGQVTFDETRLQTIAPKIDGWVETLYVNATGQSVAAGDPLLTIYSPMLVSAQEELLLAKKLLGDVASADASTRRNAEELLASARRRLAYWDIPASELVHAEQMGHVQRALTLRSTAGGYVLEKNVVAGQRIMAGDALYKVADLSAVWIEGEVFEQDIASVRLGQMVHIDLDALPGEHRMGRISYIYPTLDPQTRTVRVRVAMANPGLQLKPGMYATIRIDGTTAARVLTVPRSAVLSTGERSIVFVKEANGQFTPREVVLGGSNDERIQILRGLTAGDAVVASATFLVDAESNLGTALGGMGNMPGMDMTTPPKPAGTAPASATPTGVKPAAPTPAKDPMANMPGMDHSAHTAPKKP